MTGQGGGIHEARARFSAEVESALTRARRAASEARARSGEFRRDTAELAEQAKTGRLRGVRRDQVEPTDARARADAVRFGNANGLVVEEYPGADALIARLPGAAPAAEDEDFSQHLVLVDADARDEDAADPDGGPDPDEVPPPVEADPAVPHADEDEDFSQQRILLDATAESYRPESLSTGLFEPTEPENPS